MTVGATFSTDELAGEVADEVLPIWDFQAIMEKVGQYYTTVPSVLVLSAVNNWHTVECPIISVYSTVIVPVKKNKSKSKRKSLLKRIMKHLW